MRSGTGAGWPGRSIRVVVVWVGWLVLGSILVGGPDEGLAGRWRGGGLVITLRPDGTGAFGDRPCQWSFAGGVLQFRDDRHPAATARYRVERTGVELTLIAGDGTRYELRRLPDEAGPPAPPGGVFRSSRVALARVAGYHPASDGSCRLPVPSGGAIRGRVLKGGPFYDAVRNRVVQRPDRAVIEWVVDGVVCGEVAALQGGFYPSAGRSLTDVFGRAMADFLREEMLEGERYRVEGQPRQSTWNGVPKVEMTLVSGAGQRRRVFYLLEQVQDPEGAAVVLSLRCDQFGQVRFHGLKARQAGDVVVVGRAALTLDDAQADRHADLAMGVVAGLALDPPGPNPVLERAVAGRWSRVREVAEGAFVGGRMIVLSDGRYTRSVDVSAGAGVGRVGEESGQWTIRGNLIHLRSGQGGEWTGPVRLERDVLRIGDAVYSRER